MSSGFASANYFTAQYLTPMRKAGYIAQVGEANPHSPRLEYKITAKGCREIANGWATPPLSTPPKGSDPLPLVAKGVRPFAFLLTYGAADFIITPCRLPEAS